MTRTTLSLACLLLTACGGAADPTTDDSAPGGLLGCDSPEAILDHQGAASGYVRCADGAINRSEALPVDMAHYDEGMLSCPEEKAGNFACSSDTDCTARPNGRCTTFWTGFVDVCDCVYLCGSDSDCEADEICLSPKAAYLRFPECVPASCTQDADCPSGECGVGSASDGNYRTGAAHCRSEADDCHGDNGCSESSAGILCLMDEDQQRFTCQNYWYYD